ncbi:signal transduction histidine kinase [Kibdelosporangium banguiense]|uniref:histidine kinase n=1 Tax=Kibdelosporangium banguiense TaxID=1365924 RepID=A0ABS4TTH9_9PSEU|nr:sensor histidine kinase [Kibdelosporangium banguiense]MBP2327708.1 signal transduction histidine kinase [Kibdelosporangium banguiense]
MRQALVAVWPSLRYLLVGFVTALASWIVLSVVLVSLVVYPLLPHAVRLMRRVVAYDRGRVAAFSGTAIPERYEELGGSLVQRVVTAASDPATRRDVVWLLLHALTGMLTGGLAVGIPSAVVQNALAPLYWWAIPGGVGTSFGIVVDSWSLAAASPVVAVALLLLGRWLIPVMAAWDVRWSSTRLAPPKATLVQRMAELTATRAAALEAHGAELRRIERDLHDGTQNRLVAVVMMLGIMERSLKRDPDSALPLIVKAQDAATDALAELRDVVRSIHPPVLADRGLDGAVDALAARSPIPCTVAVDSVRRLPAAVESAAYFVVAEALTNVAKHSGATQVTVRISMSGDALTIEIADDGRGGADEDGGTGLNGIRRRIAAFDGQTAVTSPPGGPTVVRAVVPAGA